MQNKLLLTVCLIISNHVSAETEIKGTPADLSAYLSGIPKTVSISGEAEVRLPADKAIVSLKVSTESKALHETLHSNQEVRTKLVAFLQKQGIPSDRVKASRFSSTPKFGLFGEKAKSYRVDNLVKISVEDERELQIAASAVDSWPEVQFVGAEFEHANKDALKARAVAEACDNADKRRKIYEEKFGFKLIPSKFTGGAVSQRMPAVVGNYPVGYERKTVTRALTSASPSAGLPEASGDGAALHEDVSAFGELIYTAEVTVEYEVKMK